VYLFLDMADITSGPGANCISVLAPKPTKGPEPRTLVRGVIIIVGINIVSLSSHVVIILMRRYYSFGY
jgi:hypothetical protein